MKKINIAMLIVLTFVLSTNVFALCEDKNLVTLAQNINIRFIEDKEIVTVEKDENGEEIEYITPKMYAYVLAFNGITDDLKVTVYDPLEEEMIDSEYSEKHKAYIVGSSIHYEPKSYVIYVYSANENVCYKEELAKIKYTVPAFNEYSLSEFCKNNPNVKECAINYDSSNITKEDFNKIEEENKSNEDGERISIFARLKQYWYLTLIPILLISIYYIIKIFAYKKKESRI